MPKIERNINPLLIVGVIFLIVFSGTFIFKFKNQEIESNSEYNLNKLEKEAKEKYYQGEYQASIKLYQKIIDEHSKELKVHKDLAVVYETTGNYQAAINHYQEVISINSKEYSVYYNLGELYYNLNRYQKALPNFKKATKYLEDKEILKSTYLYLAKIYEQQMKYELALDAVNKALEIDSNSALAYYYLGQIRDVLGKREAAIIAYKQVIKKDGSFENVHFNLAEDYFKLKKYQIALRKYKKVLAQYPSNSLAQKRLESIKQLKPELFRPPKKEEEDKPEEEESVLDKEVNFAEIKSVPGKEDLKKVKIGLATNRNYLAFRADSKFIIKAKDKNKVLFTGAAKEPWQLEMTKKGKIKLLDKDGDLEKEFEESIMIETTDDVAPILLHDIKYGQGYYWAGKEDRQYRGKIEIKPGESSFTVINHVNMAGYLYSVVPSEMWASWPVEALQVQAVAARSYTLFHLGKHGNEGYDLCSTVHCASYKGITREYPKSTKAVNETIGEVLTYNGKPINAVYSANSGGHTESSADVWGGKVPYLQGVTTTLTSTKESKEKTEKLSEFKETFPLSPYELQSWLRKYPESYSAKRSYGRSNRYRWQRIIDAKEIASKLDIGKIKKIVPVSRAEGGTVKALRIVGTEGEEVIERGLRSFFNGLRSSRFFIITRYGNDGLPEQFLFYGGGWGHNVGMDQVATAHMAKAGYSYDQILLHFYTDVKLTKEY
ncbi:SpoIID/LytB domain-containing protein [Selenihalanaerobacter shriftii]|uniref:SpoIID/LytB domain protein n=1 Tax=Selenihalanaerobacter shriftii TaxID=142842 RepID=A0A1T4QHR4_9FIRM|nr:SpoIID/LytB domain-containing protein [Selenihalanaerobacter shriftii]SKA03333.1 SpoIID/LytB domain protein [Selenihalanaerobacter shriftii]